jgi:hypothetical protein
MCANPTPDLQEIALPRLALAAVFLFAIALIVSPPSAHADELLSNGGFEQGVSPWEATHGDLEVVGTPVRSGSVAARLAGSGLQSHEVYRYVAVAPDETYELSAWVLLAHPGVERVFLRISWFNSGGGLVSQADSAWLTIPDSHYQRLATGPVTSPMAAVSARVGIRVQVSAPFEIHLDDSSFTGAIPPPPTVAPTSSPTPPVTGAPTASPSPPSRTPTPTPEASPGGSPVQEPQVFDRLTNGGFEILRADGTAYGWKDVGADLRTVIQPVREGHRALSVTSRTSSTKWAYQTVRVQPGQYYEASGYGWGGDAGEAFLRVSWYRTLDGSGPAIDSADSEDVTRGGQFGQLRTGPIQAPSDALTAKVRLMLRPDTTAETVAYFDAITFSETSARPALTESDQSGGATGPRSNAAGSRSSGQEAHGSAEDAEGARVERYPLGFANVQPVATAAPSSFGASTATYDWLAMLGIAVGLAAIALAGVLEWSHRRKGRGEGEAP